MIICCFSTFYVTVNCFVEFIMQKKTLAMINNNSYSSEDFSVSALNYYFSSLISNIT